MYKRIGEIIIVTSLLGWMNSAFSSAIAIAPNGGAWVQTQTRGTVGIGGPQMFPAQPGDQSPGVIVAVPGGGAGYWVLVTPTPGAHSYIANGKEIRTGALYAYGNASLICGQSGSFIQTCSDYDPNKDARKSNTPVSAAATPDGKGMWVLDRFGHVSKIGTAKYYGDSFDRNQTGDAVEIVGVNDDGYFIVTETGYVYPFGSAWELVKSFGQFDRRLIGRYNRIRGAALSRDPSGDIIGYWLVEDDGKVFNVGGAPPMKSSAYNPKDNVVGISAQPYGRGYTTADTDANYEAATLLRVRMHSVGSSNFMDVKDGDTKWGSLVVQMPASEEASQWWDEYPIGNGSGAIQLVNAKTNQCLNVSGATGEIIQWPCQRIHGSDLNDRWSFHDRAIGRGGQDEVQLSPESAPEKVLSSPSTAGSQLDLALPGSQDALYDKWNVFPQ